MGAICNTNCIKIWITYLFTYFEIIVSVVQKAVRVLTKMHGPEPLGHYVRVWHLRLVSGVAARGVFWDEVTQVSSIAISAGGLTTTDAGKRQTRRSSHRRVALQNRLIGERAKETPGGKDIVCLAKKQTCRIPFAAQTHNLKNLLYKSTIVNIY